MCGRFAFFSSHEAMLRVFALPADTPQVEPRWNIAPSQSVAAVRGDAQGQRRLVLLHWGLVPHWAKERSIGARMINARAETVAEKPAFRGAWKHRRCLVLVDGYYEWQATPLGKQPWFIRRADAEPFALAGLWETWTEAGGAAPLESCAILTTAAPRPLDAIHERVPVIIPATAWDGWLRPEGADLDALAALLVAPTAASLRAVRVGRRVNNVRNDGPDLIEPVADAS
jgi:putative SOS response-associated peptidase YedK